jgi:hypothetical protein
MGKNGVRRMGPTDIKLSRTPNRETPEDPLGVQGIMGKYPNEK